MTTQNAMQYRRATRDELDLAVQWAADEGWNPGLTDAEIFWHTDPEGFVCVELDGEVIATGSIVNYGGHFGFMGFFIVRPDLRARGIGGDFWVWRRDSLLKRLNPNAAIGMDGVFDMQSFYAKGGFEFSHRNLRMEGTGRANDQPHSLVPLSEVPIETIVAYDARHFGFERRDFMEAWIHVPNSLALGAYEGDTLHGIGVIRPCRTGFKIGPLFADTPEIADSLFCALSSHAVNQPVYLDVPENNAVALELAESHQLAEVFGCARMYHGPAPQLPWDNIFGITTFELG